LETSLDAAAQLRPRQEIEILVRTDPSRPTRSKSAWLVARRARKLRQDKPRPRVLEASAREKARQGRCSPRGELGFGVGPLPRKRVRAAGVEYVSYGLIRPALERVDSGYRATMACEIARPDADPRIGSDAHREILPKVAREGSVLSA